MSDTPNVTIVVPSFNQARYLDAALDSIFEQEMAIEVFVMDGSSTDGSVEIIKKWEHKLAGWVSEPDTGQSAAINRGMKLGTAPYVSWLNSDDVLLPGALTKMIAAIDSNTDAPAVYGKCLHIDKHGNRKSSYLTMPFNRFILANYCFIAQPATLIRRVCWEGAGGLNEKLHFAMDYELWWKLSEKYDDLFYLNDYCAANRVHSKTKTHNNTDMHYEESMKVVAQYYGSIPIKWYILKPFVKMYRRLSS
jgi:glycosyltransferase involved in cell wall biosynthesis